MGDVVKIRDILYVIFMLLFAIFAYIFIDRGINLKTKNYINYQENSDILYRVYLLKNDFYDQDYLNMNERYVSEFVSNIDFNFKYKILFTNYVNGYYTYNVKAVLNAYQDSITDIVWKNEYVLVNNTTEILNQENKGININKNASVDFLKYKKELDRFKEETGINVSGYLEVYFNLEENFDFRRMDNVIKENKTMKAVIPLSYNTFRINTENNIGNNISNYYNFTKNERVNYLLLVFGAFCVALSCAFLALVIKDLIVILNKESRYSRDLKKIFNEYGDIIVKVKRFYNKKKYNLIYVNSFQELLDVYNKVRNPISYREIKEKYESIFLLIDEDNAWIYRMIADNKK